MRIIAGLARGMPLVVPRGVDTRPTSDRVREAIFSSLGNRVVEADVLDLYAGTGALGLEAASRGARSVVLIERARQALVCLEKNLAEVVKRGGDGAAIIALRGDVVTELAGLRRSFSLILADPPYGTELEPLLETVQKHGVLVPEGVLVLETAKRDEWTPPSAWSLSRDAVYGDTRVSYLRLGAG